MFNDIWKYLTEVLLKDAEVESKSSRINSEHDAFLSNRSLLYVGNEDYIKKLTANINLGISYLEHFDLLRPSLNAGALSS